MFFRFVRDEKMRVKFRALDGRCSDLELSRQTSLMEVSASVRNDFKMDEGIQMIPTQWVDTDKKLFMKRAGMVHVPEYKSRMVACGQFEDCEGIRTDSPTVDVEGLILLCSFCIM